MDGVKKMKFCMSGLLQHLFFFFFTIFLKSALGKRCCTKICNFNSGIFHKGGAGFQANLKVLSKSFWAFFPKILVNYDTETAQKFQQIWLTEKFLKSSWGGGGGTGFKKYQI